MPNCNPLDHLAAVAAKPGHAPPDPHGHGTATARPLHHANRIIGRVTRHSGARNVTVKRAAVPLHGCQKVAARSLQAALLPRIVPAMAAVTAITGGSGVIGGFGLTPNVADGSATCTNISCNTGIALPEPASAVLLAIATLLVLTLRAARPSETTAPAVRGVRKSSSFLKKRTKKLLLIILSVRAAAALLFFKNQTVRSVLRLAF